jgi:preprotein translocase subunit SecG
LNALIITLHIMACIVLVVLVLLQSGKEGMGIIFGGSSSSLFGSGGAGGLLSKLTIGAAVVFFATSLSLTYLSGRTMTPEGKSIILEMEQADPSAREGIVVPERENAGQPGEESVNTSTPESSPSQGTAGEQPAAPSN